MKIAGVRWMLAAAGLGLTALCPGSLAVLEARAQAPATNAGQAKQENSASLWVTQGNFWRPAPNALMRLKGLIRLDVRVHDAAGTAVAGLERDDFTLLDNGRPRSLVAFRPSSAAGGPAGPSPGVSVVVLLDTLDLPPEFATEERQQVVAFLRAGGGHLPWPATIYTFEDHGFYLTAAASEDGNALAAAVLADDKQHPLPLQTPVPAYSPASEAALARASRLRQLDAEASPLSTGMQVLATIAAAEDVVPGRKVLLWVGPGLRDSGTGAYLDKTYRTLARAVASGGGGSGSYTPSDTDDAFVRRTIFDHVCWLLTLLRQAGITVDVFSVGESEWRSQYIGSVLPGDPQGNDRQERWLHLLNAWKPYVDQPDSPEHAGWIDLYKKVVAVQSGGQVLPDEEDIARLMNQCVRAADIYYTLTFDPAPAAHPDELHALQLKLRSPGLTAETVREYYDEPWYQDLPYGGARPVTVSGLESLLAHAPRDADRGIEDVALTERLSQAELSQLDARIHGSRPQATLKMLADEAEFQPPPPSDSPADPAPSAAEQQQMVERALQYLEKTIPRLPDFFAVRQAERFASSAAFDELSIGVAAAPLHRTDAWKANVLYRQGKEVVLEKEPAGNRTNTPLRTYGTFGPALLTLRSALGFAQGLLWSRWERGTAGRVAVFAFAVPNTLPNQYAVVGCCVPDRAGDVRFALQPGYHGEVAIDPQTGAILRFEIEANLAGFAPVEQSAIMVAYGPATIGGHSYLVPRRSVSLVRARVMATLQEWNLSFRTWGPEETSMEVFTFDHYRMFRSSVKILPGFEPLAQTPQ